MKIRKRRIKKIKSMRKLKVYSNWTQEQLDMYPIWALVRNNPADVIASGKLNEDASKLFWVPLNMNSAPLRNIYWLDVVKFKIEGKVREGMCRACDKRLFCAADGQNTNPDFNCTATRQTFVEIKRRKKRVPAEEVPASDS